jgi:caa(3)-type oxidase subunit IV
VNVCCSLFFDLNFFSDIGAFMSSHAAHDSHAAEGDHGHSHGHVIVPPITLATILGLLLFFTLLTVGAAQAEIWAMNYFNITLPGWVNIVGAMTIATIKCVLVMAYFMQLRYDSPLNTIVMLFTILGVGLFIGFTSLDLLTRNRVYADKATIVVPGGTGVDAAKKKKLEAWGPEKFAAIKAVVKHDHHGHEDHNANTGSRSRSVTGLTGALSTAVGNQDAHGKDAHGNEAHGGAAESKPAH